MLDDKKINHIFVLLRIFVDFFIVFLMLVLAYKIRLYTDLIPGIQIVSINAPSFKDYLDIAFYMSCLLIFVNFFFGHYKMYEKRGIYEIPTLFISTTFWMMSWLSIIFIIRIDFFSRLVLVWSWLLIIVFLSFGRILLFLIENYIYKKMRLKILILGKGKMVNQIASQKKQNNEIELKQKWTGSTDATQIFDLRSSITENEYSEILNWCRENHVRYFMVPNIIELQSRNVFIDNIAGIPVLEMKNTSLDEWGAIIKRLFDFCVSFLAMVILSPVFIVFGILIKLDSRGPTLYKNQRVGKKGSVFDYYKFRYMKIECCTGDEYGGDNAKEMEEKLIKEKNTRNGALYKIANDPRKTRFGSFLERWSLDELPSLWNVLKGDISLVGPRPHQPREVEKYESWQKRLFAIKPGITGMAQISGRDKLNFDEEAKIDIEYIEKWNIWLDIVIIFKTFFHVIKRGLNKK